MSHTILLIQSSYKPQSRRWIEYETVDECLLNVCEIFEVHQNNRSLTSTPLTYDIDQLFEFIDRMADLSCLVWYADRGMYAPHNKQWIKTQIYILLRSQVLAKKPEDTQQ